MIVTIYVTKNDIDKGTRGDSDGCAISRAMRRRLKIKSAEVSNCLVTRHTIEYGPMQTNVVMNGKKGQVFYGVVTQAAADFIDEYDHGKGKPFRFKMNVPDALVRLRMPKFKEEEEKNEQTVDRPARRGCAAVRSAVYRWSKRIRERESGVCVTQSGAQ